VSVLVSSLELGDSTAHADSDAFGPDGIILIRPTGEVSHEEGGSRVRFAEIGT